MYYDGGFTPPVTYDGNLYPIKSVNGANVPNDLPCPSSYSWKLSDVSASDAGRTEDGLMHKKRLSGSAGQKRHLELEWANIYRSDASKIIQAFNSEYFEVTYWDVLDNGYRTDTFYSGDRESPMYNMALGIQSSVKFNIIQR